APDGSYLLLATRSEGPLLGGGGRMSNGTPARTGDANVQVLLESGGGVRGKVLFADGHAPPFYTVRVGRGGGIPMSSPDGAFLIEDVAPGEVTVVVGGLGFEPGQARATVEADRVSDVGTITVKPGRSISGRVVTTDHRPAPGANIFVGSVIIGDGTQPGNVGVGIGQGGLSTLFLAANGGQPPIQTTSDADGQFTLVAVGSNDLVLL